jgi:hypothetical protein
METEGDFYYADINDPSHHTFRLFNQSGEILRGVYYSDSKRSYTFLHRHENLADIISTTEHENMHAAIDQCREWEWDSLNLGEMLEADLLSMDDNEEHSMMRVAIWGSEYGGMYKNCSKTDIKQI